MNEKEKIYNQLHHDAPIQIIPAPEDLFVEYIHDRITSRSSSRILYQMDHYIT